VHKPRKAERMPAVIRDAVVVTTSLLCLAGCSSRGDSSDPVRADDAPSATAEATDPSAGTEAEEVSFVEEEATTCVGIERDELDRWFIEYGFGGVRVGTPDGADPCAYPLSDPDQPGLGPAGRLTVALTDSVPAPASAALSSWTVDEVACSAYADSPPEGGGAAVAQCELVPDAVLLVGVQLEVPTEYAIQADSSSMAAMLELLTPEIVPLALAAVNGQPPPEAPAAGPSLNLSEVEQFCAAQFVPAMNGADPLTGGQTWAITNESHSDVGVDSEYGVSEYPDQSRTTCGIGPNGGSSVAYFTVYEFPFNDIEDADLDDDPITAADYKSQHPDWSSGYIEVDNLESCRLSGDQYLYCIQSRTEYRADDVLDAVFGAP